MVAGDGQQTWSGKRIVLVAPDASSYRFLTTPEVAASMPAWSPDGSQIAYVASPDLGADSGREALMRRRIWVMGPDGTNPHQLTDGEDFRDDAPMWSADGESILFARLAVPADDCAEVTFELMRYELADGSVDTVASDLPLAGSYNNFGNGTACDRARYGILTDVFGNLSISGVFAWWQPGR